MMRNEKSCGYSSYEILMVSRVLRCRRNNDISYQTFQPEMEHTF